jgi:hypothetical protein
VQPTLTNSVKPFQSIVPLPRFVVVVPADRRHVRKLSAMSSRASRTTEYAVFTDDNQFLAYLAFDLIRPLVSRNEARPVRKGKNTRYVLNSSKSALARNILRETGSTLAGINGQQATHYTEKLDALTGRVTCEIVTLMKYREGVGFVRWGANDGFRKNRFNPDTLQTPMFAR